MSDRIAVMSNGRLEQCGTPEELYERPRNELVASFIGENNILGATVVEGSRERAVIELEGLKCEAAVGDVADVTGGDEVSVCVRPENLDLSIDSRVDAIEATVVRTVFTGANWKVLIRCNSGAVATVAVKAEAVADLAVERAIWAVPAAGAVRVLQRR